MILGLLTGLVNHLNLNLFEMRLLIRQRTLRTYSNFMYVCRVFNDSKAINHMNVVLDSLQWCILKVYIVPVPRTFLLLVFGKEKKG